MKNSCVHRCKHLNSIPLLSKKPTTGGKGKIQITWSPLVGGHARNSIAIFQKLFKSCLSSQWRMKAQPRRLTRWQLNPRRLEDGHFVENKLCVFWSTSLRNEVFFMQRKMIQYRLHCSHTSRSIHTVQPKQSFDIARRRISSGCCAEWRRLGLTRSVLSRVQAWVIDIATMH